MAKTACVIGATGGIGSATVHRLERDGWSPVLQLDLNGPIPVDLADAGSVESALAEARRRVPRLDLLVIASGILDNAKLAGTTLEHWNHVLAVNLTGPFLCCKLAREWIVDGGRIVMVSSLAGRTGGILTGTSYSVSKGGLETLTKAVAQELAPRGILVNCVSPGGVDTPMLARNTEAGRAALNASTPLKRMARPEEIAAAIAFLASDDASYMTGVILPVNGGLRMD